MDQLKLLGLEDNVADRSFSMEQHDKDAALIARGINPYNAEFDETLFGQIGSADSNGTFTQGNKNYRPTKMNYELFGQLIRGRDLKPNNPFVNIDAKRRILRMSGYDHLIGERGERVTIDSAKDHRVGLAFQHTTRTYNNRQA